MFEEVLNTPVFRFGQGNVLCHHKKILIGYFEFLHGSMIICLPLNVSEKLHWQHLFENLEEGGDSSSLSLLIRYNTRTLWRTTSIIQTNGDHHHFFIGIPLMYLVALVHSVDKTHVLVVTVELIWSLFLNILSLNFVSTLHKFLSFTRFGRSYVNCLAVILIKVTLHFCLVCAVQSGHIPFFSSCLSQMMVHLHNLFLLNTPVAWMLLTPRWVSRRKDVK